MLHTALPVKWGKREICRDSTHLRILAHTLSLAKCAKLTNGQFLNNFANKKPFYFCQKKICIKSQLGFLHIASK